MKKYIASFQELQVPLALPVFIWLHHFNPW